MSRTLFTNATFWPGQVEGKTFGAMLVDGQRIVHLVMVIATQSLVVANTSGHK